MTITTATVPLIAAATLAYAAGLLLGFGGVVVSALVAGGVAGVAGLVQSRPRITVLAIVLLAGALTAHEEDARGAGNATGSRARTGTAMSMSATGGSGLARARAEAGHRIDRIFGRDAPMARALLIADARSIPIEMRDRYATAGLVHMLSISGLHVAIIAEALHLMFSIARLSPQSARLGTILVTAFYIALIGAPPPAVRSGVMLGAATAMKIFQRATSPWAPIALGALLPLLLDSRTVLDLGYQLSVAGIAALAASGALLRRLPARVIVLNAFGRAVCTSVIATLVTAPLIAWHFGRISIIAPLTNLAAGPVIGFAQPMLFAALVLAPAEPLARFVADAVHPLLGIFDGIASAGAAIPYASLDIAPTLPAACLAGIASAAFIVATVSRFPGRALLTGALAIAVMAWLPEGRVRPGMVELHVIDVGQGDALAIRSAHGEWLLVDAGRSWQGGDAGRATVIPYLRKRGGRVTGFVLSHPHADHAGGAASVIRALRPAVFWDPAFVAPSEGYRGLLRSLRDTQTRWRRVHPRDAFTFDDLDIEFLGPDSAWTAALADPNEASAVVLVRIGSVRFLLVGDAERAEEAWLLSHARESLRADVLKVGHHGSATSSTAEFLAAVDPRIAVISVGAGNVYHHPSPDVLRALSDRGAEVLRTDQVGDVVIRTDGDRIWIVTRNGTWESSAHSGKP